MKNIIIFNLNRVINDYFIDTLFKPPSQPSPKGEGVSHFPLGGDRKGGKNKCKNEL